MASAGVFIAFGSEVDSVRLASVVLAGGAGALYLSQSSFWSVTADIAGGSAGSVSGFMNMGGQIGGRAHRLAYAMDRRALWMERLFSGGCRPLPAGGAKLAGGRSAEDVDADTTRRCLVRPALPHTNWALVSDCHDN